LDGDGQGGRRENCWRKWRELRGKGLDGDGQGGRRENCWRKWKGIKCYFRAIMYTRFVHAWSWTSHFVRGLWFP